MHVEFLCVNLNSQLLFFNPNSEMSNNLQIENNLVSEIADYNKQSINRLCCFGGYSIISRRVTMIKLRIAVFKVR